METREPLGVDQAARAADAEERDAVATYVRRRNLVADVIHAMRRAEAAARLEAALRLAV